MLTERLCAEHVREMDEQRALFARAQQKQSPFTQAADEIEFLIQMVHTCLTAVEAALPVVKDAYPGVRVYSSGEYVRGDGTQIAPATIDADQNLRRLVTAHKTLCNTVAALRDHALTVARRKPGTRGGVLPPRIATRCRILLTVALPGALHCLRYCSHTHGKYTTANMHDYILRQSATTRELCDNLTAVLWDEELIMPLQPPAKRRRKLV